MIDLLLELLEIRIQVSHVISWPERMAWVCAWVKDRIIKQTYQWQRELDRRLRLCRRHLHITAYLDNRWVKLGQKCRRSASRHK